MEFPDGLRYTQTHEWAKRTGNRVRVGITEYAQHEISDVVFVELPKSNLAAMKAKAIAVVESVKAAFDIYAPVSGTVVDTNKSLESDPSLVNKDPYGRGWFYEIEMSDSTEWGSLLTAEQYQAQCTTTH